jgi:hypothetical protein
MIEYPKAKVCAAHVAPAFLDFQAPWKNGIAERLIETLYRKCLDHVVVFDERHLRRLLSAYAAY